jgi:hypothetical protein
MKSYVLRAGSKYTLVQDTPNKKIITPAVADRDISFDGCELVEVDTVTKILHFRTGNRHYYANNSNVSVIH